MKTEKQIEEKIIEIENIFAHQLISMSLREARIRVNTLLWVLDKVQDFSYYHKDNLKNTPLLKNGRATYNFKHLDEDFKIGREMIGRKK